MSRCGKKAKNDADVKICDVKRSKWVARCTGLTGPSTFAA